MKVIHKFKTIKQDVSDEVNIITACEKDVNPDKNCEEFLPTSVDWEDVTCGRCLKKRIKIK